MAGSRQAALWLCLLGPPLRPGRGSAGATSLCQAIESVRPQRWAFHPAGSLSEDRDDVRPAWTGQYALARQSLDIKTLDLD
ncbi:hypothetical protein GCM10009841_34210 [Microlunatus panaciterrae]